MKRTPISQKTVKRLFAASGGICAFPGCNTRLVDPDSGALLGEMCHIHAASLGGPRYDPSLSDDDRNKDSNLIILCPTHHSLIDQDEETYTSAKLKSIKNTHEETVIAILSASNTSTIKETQTSDLARQIDSESVDFAIVVALKKEFEALQHYIPELEQVTSTNEDMRSYYKATLSAVGGSCYRIVVTLLPTMGNLDAAHATADLINRWNPRYILVTGLAGGLNRQSQNFGDIVASEAIVYYEPGKVQDGTIEPRNRQFLADRRLLDGLQNLRDTNWKYSLPERPDGKPSSIEIPRIHIGPIASGEKVIASDEEVSRLLSSQRNLIGIEMESAGVASAAFSALKKIGFITIRSICDFADNQKNDNWHSYAAHAAAACLRAFLVSRPVGPSEGDWPTPQTRGESLSEDPLKQRKLLFNELCSAFDMEDFKSFCFVLGVDVDELPGDKKSARVRELILLFERQGQIDALEEAFSDFRFNSIDTQINNVEIIQSEKKDSILLKDYFLIGCGIGNRMVILPVPPGNAEDKALSEFAEKLHKLDLGNSEIPQRLSNIAKTLADNENKEKVKSALDQYFDIMNDLPDLIHKVSTDEQYKVMNLGKLLFEIPTLAYIEKNNNELLPTIIALESIVAQVEITPNIKKELLNHIKSIREEEDYELLMDQTNKLSRTIYMVL